MKKRKLISITKYAELANISRVGVWKRIKAGTLKKTMIKGLIYIDVTDKDVLTRQKAGRKRQIEEIER